MMFTYRMKNRFAIKLFTLLILLLFSSSILAKDKVKNIILFIGDGMGPQQIGIAMTYAKLAPHSVVPGRTLYLEKIMKEHPIGFMTTWPVGAIVNDSAGSGTQMSTGQQSRTGMIGVNAIGDIAQNVIERAKANGLSTGVVTTTRITNATPAVFVVHNVKRSSETDIAIDLIKSGVDVLMGGGLNMLLPKSIEDKNSEIYKTFRNQIPSHISLNTNRKNEQNLVIEAQKLGYEFVFDKITLHDTKAKKVIGTFASSHLPDALTLDNALNSPISQTPKLSDMVEKTLSILSQNDKGFFIMVEGGLIDFACHYNDVGSLLHEMLQFDEAVGVAYEWAKGRDDTLILVTGDHETASPSFFYASDSNQKPIILTGNAFNGAEYKASTDFGNPEILDRLYNQKRTNAEMVNIFNALPDDQKSPQKISDIIFESTGHRVTSQQATDIFQSNVKDENFREMMVDDSDKKTFLISRALRNYHMIGWASTAHSATPLIIMMSGPSDVTNQFGHLMHDTEFGRLMNNIVSETSDKKANLSIKEKHKDKSKEKQTPTL